MIGMDWFLGNTSLDVDGLALFLRLVGGDGLCLVHTDLLGLVLAMLLSDLLLDLPWNCGAFSSRDSMACFPGDIDTILVGDWATVLPGNIFTGLNGNIFALFPFDISALLHGFVPTLVSSLALHTSLGTSTHFSLGMSLHSS